MLEQLLPWDTRFAGRPARVFAVRAEPSRGTLVVTGNRAGIQQLERLLRRAPPPRDPSGVRIRVHPLANVDVTPTNSVVLRGYAPMLDAIEVHLRWLDSNAPVSNRTIMSMTTWSITTSDSGRTCSSVSSRVW